MATHSNPAAAVTPEERGAALEFLRQLAVEVSEGTVDLPCFPNVVVRVSEALMNPATTSEQVVTIVGAEPRLAARLIQTANSAAFNTTGSPVTELRSAIIRIGHQMVQSIAVSYAMQQMQHEASLRSIAQPLADLWDRSVAVASISQLVADADARGAPEPGEVAQEGISAFASVGLSAAECQATIVQAERRIALVRDALK